MLIMTGFGDNARDYLEGHCTLKWSQKKQSNTKCKQVEDVTEKRLIKNKSTRITKQVKRMKKLHLQRQQVTETIEATRWR